MQIGTRILNENEAEWVTKHAKDVLAKATSGIKDGLNINVTENEVASLLKYLWNNSSRTDLTYDDIEPEVNTSDGDDVAIGEDDDY